MAVINSIADREQDMKAWRHLLHQHPETSYEEVWTSDFIAAKLQSFGIEIHRGMGKFVHFLHWQRVHISPQSDCRRAIASAAQNPNNASFAHATMNLDTK